MWISPSLINTYQKVSLLVVSITKTKHEAFNVLVGCRNHVLVDTDVDSLYDEIEC